MITKKKGVKLAATKNKIVKKNITTFYGLVPKKEIKECVDNKFSDDIMIQSCKSDHMNHSINSFMHELGEDERINDYLVLKMEVLGQPIVKTTREVTIKK